MTNPNNPALIKKTLKIQKLKTEQAEYYKKEMISKGEADSEYKRKMMIADGALEQKLAAYKEVNKYYAQAMGRQKWVPEIMFGGGNTTASHANDFINLMTIQAAKQLGLDMTMSHK